MFNILFVKESFHFQISACPSPPHVAENVHDTKLKEKWEKSAEYTTYKLTFSKIWIFK